MIAFLTTFIIVSSNAFAEEQNADAEFSFIEEGEVNRAKVESNRAPSADIFLQGDDDEEVTTWDVPSEDTASLIDDDEEVYAEPAMMSSVPVFESDDPEEDMEGLGPAVGGLTPLGDHFPLQIAQDGLGGVAAELPVLVARNNRDLEGQLWVVADVYADGIKVSESRHLVSPASLSEVGPTYIWIKSSIPVNGPSVSAEFRLFASQPGKKEQVLFSRTAQVAL